ncbi:type II secretion system protein [Photobacterium sanguinicancri]|uniref:Type II secretion system protein n=1 Tax=Photobacterium sanguinicancri TaxID=875932 RepID=A0AAW7Y849_9GAMM|nr:type II secretion system protein [Photobacterium sanguinicancri]MDO6544441.1 type II secretion system protein [Photobacterium sanguinicancri]
MTHRNRGFTLIELIVVILLIGIVSGTVASRFVGRDSFDAFLNRDVGISLARQIQIMTMNQSISSPDICYALIITPDYLGSSNSAACNKQLPDLLPPLTSNDKLAIRSSELGISQETVEMYFDITGKPFYFTGKGVTAKKVQACTAICQFDFLNSNNQKSSMCINKEGYIYAC